MLLQIATFRDRVTGDIDTLVKELQEQTRRYSAEEAKAWRASLPYVARAFSNPAFSDLHLYFGSQGSLSLEYKLPASSSWADMVMLGKHNGRPAAVVVELKNWQTKGDRPGPVEGIIDRNGMHWQHPSDQVAGYSEYLQKFHSTVVSTEAVVHGCVLFTREEFYQTYKLAPNHALVEKYPCFSARRQSDEDLLHNFFRERLTEPDRHFAEEFEIGAYTQNRGFVHHIGAQLLNSNESPFVLLENQRLAFAVVQAAVEKVIVDKKRPKKAVVIVKGPPGSGKSVVAARVWASLVTNEKLKDGNVVVTTTSAAQSSNWQHLFDNVGGKGAKGAIVTANSYTPATTTEFGSLRIKYPDAFKKEEFWRENLEMLRSMIGDFRSGSRDNEHLVSIVDEAHALINPEHTEGRGQFGFTTAFGPQAYHIMRTSVISVFLLDEQQGFRDRENTTIADIKKWADELGINNWEVVDLSESQFRCEGSIEYLKWVERTLKLERSELSRSKSAADKHVAYSNSSKTLHQFAPFQFKLFNDIWEMEGALRQRRVEGASVRLLASYSRPWKTKGVNWPIDCIDIDKDFQIPTPSGKVWYRIWNFAPSADYSLFVQARKGYPMHDDPLCEVGCPFTVRGFDFDYVGLLWMSDLVWRDDTWLVNPGHVHESGLSRALSKAKKDGYGSSGYDDLLKGVLQSYRILLTRSMKGLYIWCEDSETREYLKSISY